MSIGPTRIAIVAALTLWTMPHPGNAIEPVASAGAPTSPGPHTVELPRIEGPIPQSATSYAFNSAAHTRAPIDLASNGYVEEEYFQSGRADIYDWPAPAKLATLGSGPYVTRILVRRPRDPKHSNGAVVVEPFNPSHRVDVDLMWIYSHQYFMQEGYTWIGVTVKPVALAALKRFDANRYASLSIANPLPADQRCPDPELGPRDITSEVGFAADILSQLGALLRSDAPDNPLRDLRVTRVYLTGYSQTAGYVRDYASAISPHVRRPGGEPIYDGYLAAGQAPFNVPLNNCAALFHAGDPRLTMGPVGVPYIDVAGEGDTLVNSFMRRPDSDRAPDLFRRYEIAGATHSGSWVEPFTPIAPDFERARGLETSAKGCFPEDAGLSDFPLRYVLDALWQDLDEWVTRKAPPPHGKQLTLSSDSAGVTTIKDEHGNAIGGVRTPAVDVPTATWHSSRRGPDRCMRVGYSVPLDQATLLRLYPTHANYVRQVTADVRRLVKDRWLTATDAKAVLAEAQDFPIR